MTKKDKSLGMLSSLIILIFTVGIIFSLAYLFCVVKTISSDVNDLKSNLIYQKEVLENCSPDGGLCDSEEKTVTMEMVSNKLDEQDKKLGELADALNLEYDPGETNSTEPSYKKKDKNKLQSIQGIVFQNKDSKDIGDSYWSSQ